LAVPAGLFLVAAVRFGRTFDRLAIRDARRLEVHVDAETALQFRDGDFDVQLSLAREQQLLRLRIATVLDRWIFFFEAMHRSSTVAILRRRSCCSRARDS